MPDRIAISSQQVVEARQDVIVYVDDAGDEQFIDFEACYQNYLARRLSPEAIESFKKLNHKTDADVPAHIERVKWWREIADRNVLGDDFMDGERKPGAPYFEFHTQPRVRIEFTDRDELSEMRYKIARQFKWHTFDLT